MNIHRNKYKISALCLAVLLMFSACGKQTETPSPDTTKSTIANDAVISITPPFPPAPSAIRPTRAVTATITLNISGGTIDIPECYEGFEGTVIEISGGKSFIRSADDSVSAAAGTEEAESGAAGRGPNELVYVRISGGELEAVFGGDTVDSNGHIFVEGGTLRLSAPVSPSYEGVLLCNGDVTFTGGNVASTGRVGVGIPETSTQLVLLITHKSQQAEGSVVSLRDGGGQTLLETTALCDFADTVFSSPELQDGSTYSVYINGKKKTDVTLSGTVTKISDDGGEWTGQYPRER